MGWWHRLRHSWNVQIRLVNPFSGSKSNKDSKAWTKRRGRHYGLIVLVQTTRFMRGYNCKSYHNTNIIHRMKTKRSVFIRCLYFYTEVDIYMSPLVLRRGRDFLCCFLKVWENIWLNTNYFLPLDKWGLKRRPRKNFTVGVNFSAVFQQSNIEG